MFNWGRALLAAEFVTGAVVAVGVLGVIGWLIAWVVLGVSGPVARGVMLLFMAIALAFILGGLS